MNDLFAEVHDSALTVLPKHLNDRGHYSFAETVHDTDLALGRAGRPLMRPALGQSPHLQLLTRVMEVQMTAGAGLADVLSWTRQVVALGRTSIHVCGRMLAERYASGAVEEIGRARAVLVTSRDGTAVAHGREACGEVQRFDTEPWFETLPAFGWYRTFSIEHPAHRHELNYLGTLAGSRSAAMSATTARVMAQTVLVNSDIHTRLKFDPRRMHIEFLGLAAARETVVFVAEVCGLNETAIGVRVSSYLKGRDPQALITDARVLLLAVDPDGQIATHPIR